MYVYLQYCPFILNEDSHIITSASLLNNLNGVNRVHDEISEDGGQSSAEAELQRTY